MSDPTSSLADMAEYLRGEPVVVCDAAIKEMKKYLRQYVNSGDAGKIMQVTDDMSDVGNLGRALKSVADTLGNYE